MSIVDGPLGAVANTLVTKFGRSATYAQPPSDQEIDPEVGDMIAAESETTTSVSVLYDDARIRMFPDSLVERGDRVGLVARVDLGFEPSPGKDTLTEGGTMYRIIGAKAYSSGEQDAMYALLLRK